MMLQYHHKYRADVIHVLFDWRVKKKYRNFKLFFKTYTQASIKFGSFGGKFIAKTKKKSIDEPPGKQKL